MAISNKQGEDLLSDLSAALLWRDTFFFSPYLHGHLHRLHLFVKEEKIIPMFDFNELSLQHRPFEEPLQPSGQRSFTSAAEITAG